MPQFAWLELYEGVWYLLTDLMAKPGQAGRKWPDLNAAISELTQDGWNVADSYQNEISKKLGLDQNIRGFGLIRIVH